MLFLTYPFLFFFTVVFVLYWFVCKTPNAKKIVLIIASYFFYGCWDWHLCFLLFASTLINHLFACGVSSTTMEKTMFQKALLIIAVCVNVAVLCFFKYYDFFADSFNVFMYRLVGKKDISFLMPILHIVLPVGISFYTFKGMSLVFDASDGTLFMHYKRKKLHSCWGFVDSLLYVSFFPQVASGPIVHAEHFYTNLSNSLEECRLDFSLASVLIMSGLLKKLVFANYLSTLFVNPVFTTLSDFTGLQVFIAAVAYSSVIYCDFSGYSDMAIGIALLLGFQTPKNFDRPYSAFSIGDFWRRWHISFSMWLRKYLYFKLGGSRKGKSRTIFALSLTMLVSGLWHGASWMFVLWGGMQALALVFERASGIGKKKNNFLFIRILQVILTFFYTTISWVVFRSSDFSEVVLWWKNFIANKNGFFGDVSIASPLVLILLFVSLAIHFIPSGVRGFCMMAWRKIPLLLKALAIALFFMLLNIFSMSSVAPFIYFSF